MATLSIHDARGLSPPSPRPLRILQVVVSMNRGGIEGWLVQVLRHIDRREFQIDFLVDTVEPCAYDDEIRSLGSKIIRCLRRKRLWTYARNFHRAMGQHGPYDIIHSHLNENGGWVIRLARKAGIPVRIVHSHSDIGSLVGESGWLRRAYIRASRAWISRDATFGLAASNKAASLFGEDWRSDPRWRILYCGVDMTPFRASVQSRSVRAELGIPPNAFVMGHAGRFAYEKNHAFLIKVAAAVAKWEENSRLLLVGDGPLRKQTERLAAREGVGRHVIFAGTRVDVPRLMLGAMDVFLLPSRWEGLGLVGIEAQAAGLPLILSDGIPTEVDVVKPLVRRLSVDESAETWARQALCWRYARAPCSAPEALAETAASAFNIRTSVEHLARIYRSHGQLGPVPSDVWPPLRKTA